jgi:hypothetical protein
MDDDTTKQDTDTFVCQDTSGQSSPANEAVDIDL